jgi:DNA-binding winged helix-turn-helix (wHTH) protein
MLRNNLGKYRYLISTIRSMGYKFEAWFILLQDFSILMFKSKALGYITSTT